MSDEEKTHIIRYRTYVYILLTLVSFTLLSVLATSFELGPMAVLAALIIATIKGSLVLTYFMHLKFDLPLFRVMVFIVMGIIASVITITMVDYIFR